MNRNDIIFERELLFAVNDSNEIGVITVKLFDGKKLSKIMAVVEAKSEHNPIQHIESIIHSLDVEMFKRININIIENIDIIFIEDSKALRVVFQSKDSYAPFQLENVNLSEMNFCNI